MEQRLSGWTFFASVMMMVAGAANLLWGIGAVARDEFYIPQVLFANLTFWGILFMILGGVMFFAGIAVLYKAQWARFYGLLWAAVSIVFYFAVFWAIPLWAFTAIVLDVLVIYALAAYSDRDEESTRQERSGASL